MRNTSTSSVKPGRYTHGPKSDKTPMKANKNTLQKLSGAAKAARVRVSGYSDARRSQLEQLARGVIQGVKATQVCSR